MKIIDAHAHITQTGKWFNTPYNASFDFFEAQRVDAGVTKVILIPVAISSNIDQNYALKIAEEYPEKYYVAPLIHLKNFDEIRQLKNQIVALKIHPRLQNIQPKSKIVQKVILLAREINKPLIIDTYMQSSKLPLKNLDPYVFDYLAKKNPDINFILAHSCWPKLLDAYYIAKSNDNVYLDLSLFGKVADGTYLLKDFCFLLNNLDEKVIFGSDFPEVNLCRYTELWNGLMKHINNGKKNRILFKNAYEIFQL